MEPYLSVVIAARQTDKLARVQLFVEAWIQRAKHHSLASELIVVGPRTPVNVPDDTAPCQIRFVEAPAGAAFAKAINAGICQARGGFILATNVDVRFSDELVRFLASGRLDEAHMYRVDRYDIHDEVGVPTRVHAREGTFALTPDGLRQNMPDDIAPIHSGLNFGSGWFPCEKYPATGEAFRWIYNDAEILAAVPGGGGILLLEMEPGPGLGTSPQTFHVMGDNGAAVAEWKIAGRTTVALAVPTAAAGTLRSFRLRVSDGGRPVLDDDRILSLAVFRCEWAQPNPPSHEAVSLRSAIDAHKPALGRLLGSQRKTDGFFPAIVRGPFTAVRATRLLSRRGSDIFEAGMDFQLGTGWYYLEESESERFRWISRDARFFLRLPGATSRLAMLIEPAPNRGSSTLQFVARSENANGAMLVRRPINGLTYLEFTVPAAPGSIAALHFSAEGALQPAGADSRPLSFRIFACGAGRREISAPAAWDKWPVLPLDSRPAKKDWIAELDPVRSQLDEMGHPEHLHTNAASDFLLMSRERWLDVRGFPEIGMTPERIDSLLCYAAHHCGVHQEVLAAPMRAYHISRGAPQPDSDHYAMPPEVQQEDLMWLIAQMRSLHAPVIFNREDWGR